MPRIKIKNKWIGSGAPCFITVDIGANHNRDFSIARKLIDSAASCGVDAVKFQFYSAETLYSKKTPRHSYYKKRLWDLIKEIETPRAWIPLLAEYCAKKKIIFFATPFDFAAVDELNPYVPLYKIASFELVDLPLVSYTARQKKPLILSTGLADMEEIKDAYMACKKAGNNKIIFLQCASLYPAKPEIMNLRAMETLKENFLDTLAGLSDHTNGIHISIAAVAMGASFIEKHFTLSRKMRGPDHPFALEPVELKEMVRCIRQVELAMGDGRKIGPSHAEKENFLIARRSLHSARDIKRGTKITPDMLVVKRPGFGIKPKFIESVVGKTAKRDINKDEWIRWQMV